MASFWYSKQTVQIHPWTRVKWSAFCETTLFNAMKIPRLQLVWQKSLADSATSQPTSLRWRRDRRRSLGDKLQLLALQQPAVLHEIEEVVDRLMLKVSDEH
jgi:hypothetical protein